MGSSMAVDQRPDRQRLRDSDDPGALLLPLIRGTTTTRPQDRSDQTPRRTTMGRQGPQQHQLELLVRSAGAPRETRRLGEPGEEERMETPLKAKETTEDKGKEKESEVIEDGELAFRPRWSEVEPIEIPDDPGARDWNSWEVKASLPENYEERMEASGRTNPEGAWSLNSLIRPAQQAFDWLRSPRKRPREDPVLNQGVHEEREEKKFRPLEGRRKDLQARRDTIPSVRKKDMRLRATGAAKKSKGKSYSIEKDFFSKNGEAPRRSRRKTVERILTAAGNFGKGHISVDIMKTLASALKDAGYKSGLNYLIEAKMWHLEVGGLWDSQLDRTFKLCKAGLERGKGPKKKAPEVKRASREITKELLVRAKTCAVKFPHLLFLFGMVWMLREIEIAAINTKDFLIDYIGKKITLEWKFSKKDQEASGIKRTLQCLCEGKCAGECPFKVTMDLIKTVEGFNGSSSPVALTRRKLAPTKNQMTKAWTRTFGQKVGGHSARRTGALTYIRSGWDVGQVAYLGRWSSNIILEYAKEALEEVPVNKQNAERATELYPARCLEKEESMVSLLDTQARTQQEIKKMKSDVKAVKEKIEDTVLQLEKWAESGENLPEKVQSTHSRVVHANQSTSAVSPPFTWRTKCGWHYHFSHYVFVKASMEVTCSKCRAAQ